MIRKSFLIRLLCALIASAMMLSSITFSAFASSSSDFNLRKKALGMLGISYTTSLDSFVTRGQFAKMAVQCSTSKELLSNISSFAVFADVGKDYEHASAIRIAAENGWMTAFLGGNFNPDQPVTLNDAARAALYMLGYTANDFEGDAVNKRLAKFASLGLGTNISRNATDYLTTQDCINLFYNLLTSETAQGQSYAAKLGATVTGSGDLNVLDMTENTMKGPKYISTESKLSSWLPFDIDSANCFADGEATNASGIRGAANEGGIFYYSSKTKTIWAYTQSGSDVGASEVTIENINYKNTSTLTPSSVVASGEEFLLNDSDMQYAFSVYGSVKIGETVYIIWQTDNNGNKVVIDYVYE